MAQNMSSSVPECESLMKYFLQKPVSQMNELVGGFRYFYGNLALKAPKALAQATIPELEATLACCYSPLVDDPETTIT
jgi:hypothetical protein